MAEKSPATNDLAKTVVKYVAPFLIGALLSMLLSLSGDRQELKNNTKRLDALETRVHGFEEKYATNKRVDDVQEQVRSGLAAVNSKLDNVLNILIERR